MRWLLLLALGGCKALPDSSDDDPGIDTGWFDDTDHLVPCEDLLVAMRPSDGDADWYWREPLRVQVATDRPEAYTVELRQGGIPIPIEQVWEASGLAFSLLTKVPLLPETSYEFDVLDCVGTHTAAFRTNHYGLEIEGGSATLRGNTYLVDLAGAEWVEPGGFGTVLKLYFSQPVLVGVTYAHGQDIDLMGAVGFRDDLGEVVQDATQDTFDFPVSANSELPWFDASSDITLTIDGVPITIYGFDLSGTFAPDGSAIGGATVKGLGDTRQMGELVDEPGDPNAMCEFAGTLGAKCTACPDGQVTCLQLEARSVGGSLIPGLELIRRAPTGG